MTLSRSLRILIADDHAIVREGLSAVINREPDMRVVAEAVTWPDAVERACQSRPEIAVLDLHMPGMEPADGIATLREKCPDVQIVVFSAFGTDEDVHDVVRAGARGYVPKGESGRDDLLACLRAVSAGQTWIHPIAAMKLAEQMTPPSLTPRELDVLRLVAAGKSNKEIGLSLDVAAGQTTDMDVTLREGGQTVNGPFGDIEFKGYPRAAVLLNGTPPPYFVGHVDEFDNNWLWHQWLLVKPGTYQATVTQEGRTIWSGPVAVQAGQRVLVDLNNSGRETTYDFPRGLTLGPQPRFDAGLASAMVPIAPVTAQFAASDPNMTCGEAVDLKWKTTDAVDTSITHLGEVPAAGDRPVRPTKATTYELVAKGPGGEAIERAKVAVTEPTATLTLSRPEVHYQKIGNEVVKQGAATLSWSTSNAKSVTIDPLGPVPASGERTVEAMPGRPPTGRSTRT